MTPGKVKTFCVVLHSSGVEAGFVVRTAYDGWIPSPYSRSHRFAEYKRLAAAQRCADNMNDGASIGRRVEIIGGQP